MGIVHAVNRHIDVVRVVAVRDAVVGLVVSVEQRRLELLRIPYAGMKWFRRTGLVIWRCSVGRLSWSRVSVEYPSGVGP